MRYMYNRQQTKREQTNPPLTAGEHLLTAAEYRQVVVDWNATERDYPFEQCLHQLIEAQVARTPEKPALVFAEEQLTYRELNARANQLARYLQRLGVGPDVMVSVVMERSFEMVVALLGILKAGGAYVPLDPALPPERLAFMLEDLSVGADAQAALLLTQSGLLADLPEHRARVLCLDTSWEEIALEARENLICSTTPYNLAYVIYTSGSTGKPKGAMNTHRGICNRLLWMQETYQLTESDCVMQKTPFSFDVSVWEFFWPLLAGARLALARPGGHKDSAYLVALIQEQQVTTLHFVPSMLQVFLEEPHLEACSSLRQVFCSGEALPYTLQERFFARHSAALHNLYGPTEAAIDVTYWPCQRQSKRTLVPIGYPIANMQMYILDPLGQPVPVGVQGELFIAGVGVARGYHNRPELTAERFIKNPFSDQPEARLYRTGDLARYLPDGAIEYLGRIDQQIKLRGFRIELGEIEVVLTQHPAVREAVVTVHTDPTGDQRLIAYVVFRREQRADVPDLREHMARQVPDYMVPAVFLLLDALPLNPSGKVDRKALPPPADERSDLSASFIAPRNELEAAIAALWAEVLGIKRVSIDDNFFALGGHSLLAMRITTSLRKTFQVDLSLRDFFDLPTVGQLAAHLEQMKTEAAPASFSALPVLARSFQPLAGSHAVEAALLPASFAQQRLWFLDQMTPRNTAYNIPATIHIKTLLNIEALRRGIQTLIERHEVLRTTFALIDGQLKQVVLREPEVFLREIDLRMLPENERNARARQLTEAAAAEPFDLARGPLLRFLLLRLQADEYMLVLVIHHIVADGWSIGVFFQELVTLYGDFAHTRPLSVPALPVQYADYAAWQQALVQGELRERQLAYWQRQLAGVPTMLEIPADRPRPAIPTTRGATYHFRLSETLTAALKRFSQQEGVTLYITLVTAFQVLLHRYTGQEDLVVGTAIADRRRPEFENVLGMFLNTLALRTSFADNPDVRTLLLCVRDGVLDAYAHQDVPFEQVVTELHLERGSGQSPLFQVSLMLDPPSPALDTDWTLTRMAVGTGGSKFDLSLELDEQPGGLAGHLEYSTDLFDETTIVRLAEHWQVILTGMLTDPSLPVGKLPLLTKAERAQILDTWNATHMAYPDELCLHQLFAEQARRVPEAIAATFAGSSLTYRGLNERANQFAHYLRTLGVGPDRLVAICVERGLDMLIGLLGILKAGGAYIPLDPTYPADRLAFMLEDAGVDILVTQQRLSGQLPSHQCRVVCLDADKENFAHLSAADPLTPVASEHLCYVIYTSGSTGRPKGVQLPHRAVVNFLLSMQREPGLTSEDTLLAVTTLSFDIAGLELYLPLLTGAHLVIADRDTATSGEALGILLEKVEATVMQATPITWRLLLASGWRGKANLKALCGGEALPLELVRELLPCVASLYNMYGPTETTIWSTLSKIESAESPISIGRPIANTCLVILDRYFQPVPVGVPGELYIGGDGLARGYLKRPALTEERFLWLKLATSQRERLYRTGDVARYRSDGSVELLGRADHQVKLRGFRIELGEIETVLEQHPAVQQAVVIAREDTVGDKRLVAYIQPKAGTTIAIGELRQHAQAHLPYYMVPSALVMLDRLPQTPNGKVDRRALPAPEQDQLEAADTFVAPRSELEEIVAGAWAQTLGVQQIGIHDNFFALGGHSLLALQITSRLHAALQVELSLRHFFEAPTVARLADLIVRLQAEGTTVEQADLQPQPRRCEQGQAVLLPASAGQQGLWFLHQVNTEGAEYNIFATVRLRRSLDLVALEQSLHALMERHEALRTTFTLHAGQLIQRVAVDLTMPLICKDLRDLAIPLREQEALRLANEEFQRPFDLAQGPLVRAMVFHLAEQGHLLLLTMHHSISDGWSLGLILQELTGYYDALVAGQPAQLPEVSLQFGDFAAWQHARMEGAALAEHLAYWKNYLAGAPTVLELPTDRPRPTHPTGKGAQHTFSLSAELTAALKTLSREEHVTLYMLLVAAFQVLLQRYTGQNDLLFGTTTAGRAREGLEYTVGYFTNTLVLRSALADNPTVRALLGRVREAVLNAQHHQDMPFDHLIKELQPERTPGQSPLFQVFLTMDTPLPTLPTAWDATQLDLETGAAKFDLSLDFSERSGCLVSHLEYNTDLFDASTIARLSTHWQTILRSIVSDLAQPVAELALLTDEERQQLLVEWNTTQVPYPAEASIHQLFAEQVARTPEAIAASCGEDSLTYRELNVRANQLAHYLQKQGLRPGERVGIFIERSLDMLIGLLGILKAGGVYVPLDPTYPVERLAFMLADAELSALLTHLHLTEKVAQVAQNVICLDRDWPEIALESWENPALRVGGEDCAYMIYTSGSTGKPKGVLGTHRASLNRFHWMWRAYPFQADEVCCQKTTLSFVDSIWEIFGPLLQGVRQIIVPDAVAKDPTQFVRLLADARVTRIVLVPSLLRVLLESRSDLQQQLPCLKYWVCSGEALSVELAQQFQQRMPQAVLINLYGSSEVAADATFYEVRSAQTLTSVPIGRPIDNIRIYVLDQAMQPVPIGVAGELYIGGDGLARGYFHRPELTEARFVADPFSVLPGAKLYKTGDQARYLADGTLEYLGRLDLQVKLRGMRIELGEIEAVLGQHPAVSEAVVVIREDVPGDQRLVAYVVGQPGQEVSAGELQHFLGQQLPGYMVPGLLVFLVALPLTPNGKTDRRALPVPDYQHSTTERTYIAPQLTIHYQLIQIWEELLPVRPIGIRDNFFALGGHSLLAARLIARIAEVCGKTLPLSILFQSATVEDLATVLQEETRAQQTRTVVTTVQASGSQRPFFFLHGDWNGKAFYCLKLARELGPERPFYLLEPYLYEHLQVLPSLEQVAAAHLAAMRQIQPEGPYLLGGWCNGAMVAYEMAQQLRAAHQEVELLVMMDAGTSSPFSNLLRRAMRGSNVLLRLKQEQQDTLFFRLLHIYEYFRLWNYRKRLAAEEGTGRPPEEVEVAHPNFATLLPSSENLRDNYMAIFNWLASGYRVRPYGGDIAVFWAQEDNPGRRKVWERLLAEQSNVRTHFVPGTHMTSRTRYIESLARSLAECIERTENKS